MSTQKKQELKDLVKNFPSTPGVYIMKSETGKVIYVGKAKNLKNRVRSYFSESKDLSIKTKYLVARIFEIDYLLTKTEVEAFLVEASMIKKYKPRYNIRLKDDKAYPYIKCWYQLPYPRFELARKVKRDGALYFGPYTSGFSVKETILFLNRNFKLRDCSEVEFNNRKTPCMQYQIGRCSAPCVDYISQENYKNDIESALSFLRGQDKKVLSSLKQKMKEAATSERFEAAAKIRDSMNALKKVWEKQIVVTDGKNTLDKDFISVHGDYQGTLIETLHIRNGRVTGSRPHFINKLNIHDEGEEPRDWLTSFLNQYYMDNIIPDEIYLPIELGHEIKALLVAVLNERGGSKVKIMTLLNGHKNSLMAMAEKNALSHFKSQVEKTKSFFAGLEEVKIKLALPELPLRIECYDISHFQGEGTVASQVVFEDGEPKKDQYRKYKLKTVVGPDDYKSMYEVLSRRFEHKEYDDPQLILIDGGKGQLRVAEAVLEDLNRKDIPVASIAKARTESNFGKSEVKSTQERFFIPGRQNPITFRTNTSAFKILTQLRDEAHRFAITYHRKLRDKRIISSQLDDIPGLGEKRIKKLMEKFKTVEAIRLSKAEEISKLSSFNIDLAEKVLEALKVKK